MFSFGADSVLTDILLLCMDKCPSNISQFSVTSESIQKSVRFVCSGIPQTMLSLFSVIDRESCPPARKMAKVDASTTSILEPCPLLKKHSTGGQTKAIQAPVCW